MAEMVDHFVDDAGNRIDIKIVDHEDYVSLDAARKLKSTEQPRINWLSELPSVQGNANLFVDVAHALWD